ncbi:hypothetical protein SASPL_120985 [Salvia splendens]|uniref:Transposase Tnp1/En/Spm-like domain-containing protein n=1 Tax=Salvia splendens TaxID=180675 RepID=A0A8X8XRK9_SALSN|nr:hypothetical protein SASPL_120985 [Salvia splendens]
MCGIGANLKFNRSLRNETVNDNARNGVDVFTITGRSLGKGDAMRLDVATLTKAHQYVLFNSEAVPPYIEKHRAIVEQSNPRVGCHQLERNHSETFADWFAQHVETLTIHGENPTLKDLKLLSHIIQLDYGRGRGVVLFDCEWVSKGKRLRTDADGFTLANFSNMTRHDEPFILASQAEQVFYVEDPTDSQWRVVVSTTARANYHMEPIIDVDTYLQSNICVPPDSVDADDFGWVRDDVDGIELWLLKDEGFTSRTAVGRRTYNINMHQQASNTVRHSDHSHERVLPLPIGDMSVGTEQEQEIGDASEAKTRGPTYMTDIWGRPQNLPPISVEYNEFGQPIGGDHRKKDEMLEVVKLRFDVPIIAENWVLTSIGTKWRNWKHYLKTRYWDDVPIEYIIHDMDDRVLEEQWIQLLSYWKTEDSKFYSKSSLYIDNSIYAMHSLFYLLLENKQEKQKRSSKEVNEPENRKDVICSSESEINNLHFPRQRNMESAHRVFSYLVHVMCLRMKTQVQMSQANLYTEMAECSDQLPEGSDDAISPNDVFAQVMGKDKPGHVRMMGKGVCPSDIWNGTSKSTSNRLLMEYKEKNARLEPMLETQQRICASQVHKGQDVRNVSESSSLNPTSTEVDQVGTYVSLRSIFTNKVVAKGCIYSIDPNAKVGGQALGLNWCEINVKVVVEPQEQLIKPYENFQELSQTVGHMIAWPRSLVTPIEY